MLDARLGMAHLNDVARQPDMVCHWAVEQGREMELWLSPKNACSELQRGPL